MRAKRLKPVQLGAILVFLGIGILACLAYFHPAGQGRAGYAAVAPGGIGVYVDTPGVIPPPDMTPESVSGSSPSGVPSSAELVSSLGRPFSTQLGGTSFGPIPRVVPTTTGTPSASPDPASSPAASATSAATSGPTAGPTTGPPSVDPSSSLSPASSVPSPEEGS